MAKDNKGDKYDKKVLGTFHLSKPRRPYMGRPAGFDRTAAVYGLLRKGASDREIELHIPQESLRYIAEHVTRRTGHRAANGVYILRFKGSYVRHLKKSDPGNG